MPATSARQPRLRDMRTTFMPSHSAPLSKAACAVFGTTTSGTPAAGRCSRAQSRAAFMAMRMLSVPPAVVDPPAPSGACSRSSTPAISSRSSAARLG